MTKQNNPQKQPSQSQPPFPKQQADDFYKNKLSKISYKITRKSGTERPFSGSYSSSGTTDEASYKGDFSCICCDTALFSSDVKFDSGTGWPSFYEAYPQVGERADKSLFRNRTEVFCNQCNAHLGHVFDDGPQPTGLRYCINGGALNFTPY